MSLSRPLKIMTVVGLVLCLLGGGILCVQLYALWTGIVTPPALTPLTAAESRLFIMGLLGCAIVGVVWSGWVFVRSLAGRYV